MEAGRLVGTSPQFAARSPGAVRSSVAAAGRAAVIPHLAAKLDLLQECGRRNVTGKILKHNNK